MKDFSQYVLPWIIVAVLVALTIRHYARKK